ncbi:MAG TPA: carboxylating nicotinate-nucleotide diphosphorylase [Deltaproteobacteria bacterium]|nr:carboxylating nicotinate-nucleotide diphosphorylase [Deltaproteobacteria bacterium]
MQGLSPMAARMIRMAIEEDLGSGDVTTGAVIDPQVKGEAHLVAREESVLAGMWVFKSVFLEVEPETEFEDLYVDGDLVSADQRVCLIRGRLTAILQGERTALNFLQRMSGIATFTRLFVERVKGVRILDTRKTAPGLRLFDKYAVRMGGGFNHRFGLSDGILIKDNHIAGAGSISEAIRLARKKAPHTLKIEVEVEDLDGVEEACRTGADAILLDNMSPGEMKKAVELVNGRALTEASGGITLDTVGDVAETGVDMISIGGLTHSARAADFSLEIRPG